MTSTKSQSPKGGACARDIVVFIAALVIVAGFRACKPVTEFPAPPPGFLPPKHKHSKAILDSPYLGDPTDPAREIEFGPALTP